MMQSLSKVWDFLLFFESSEYVDSRYSEFHGGHANAGKLAEIASAFRQARLFHQAFQQADFIVRPLIVFYCFLAIARGLTLFLEPAKREANLAPKHGLACIGLNECLNQDTGELLELKVKIENGTFLELLRATKNMNFVRANSSAVNFHVPGPMPPPGAIIKFESLCARIPDLAVAFKKWTGESIRAAKLLSFTSNEIITLKLDILKLITGCDCFDADYLQ